MKPAPSAAPQGGCVDSQLDPAVAILRNAGRLREQPTFTQSLELRFATSCYWFELRSGTARPPDAVDHIMIEFPAQNALAQDSYRRQYSSCKVPWPSAAGIFPPCPSSLKTNQADGTEAVSFLEKVSKCD